jgi:hypothetical protein
VFCTASIVGSDEAVGWLRKTNDAFT